MKWSRALMLPQASPDSKSGGFDGSLARGLNDVSCKLAACAGFAPATFRSTGGCSS
jgi:hypothetical protein